MLVVLGVEMEVLADLLLQLLLLLVLDSALHLVLGLLAYWMLLLLQLFLMSRFVPSIDKLR